MKIECLSVLLLCQQIKQVMRPSSNFYLPVSGSISYCESFRKSSSSDIIVFVSSMRNFLPDLRDMYGSEMQRLVYSRNNSDQCHRNPCHCRPRPNHVAACLIHRHQWRRSLKFPLRPSVCLCFRRYSKSIYGEKKSVATIEDKVSSRTSQKKRSFW